MNSHYRILSRIELIQNQLYLNQQPVIECDADLEQFAKVCYQFLQMQYPKFYKMDIACKWGLIGAEFLLKNQHPASIDPFKRALVFQNTSSSLATDRNYQQSMATIASPALFVYTLPNIVMGEIAIRNQFKGENTFFVSAQNDISFVEKYIEMLFANGVADLVMAGNIEIASSKPTINLFLAARAENKKS